MELSSLVPVSPEAMWRGLVVRPVDAVRSTISDSIRKQVDSGEPLDKRFGSPPGDPGWFGPGSMGWRVHGDFPAMITGGISALLLQALHARAMAGVSDHSGFREDPLGRLQRTASFIGVTTYGSSVEAERVVAMVTRIHSRVVGTTPSGEPYSALDPDLLRWVHVSEVASFVKAYQRYSMSPLSERQVDRYFAETSRVAEALGATDVPKSYREARMYFREVRSELTFGDQAQEARDFVLSTTGKSGAEAAAYGLICRAAVGLLPSWARAMLGLGGLGLGDMVADRALVRPVAFGALSFLRWSLGDSEVMNAAKQRVLATPS